MREIELRESLKLRCQEALKDLILYQADGTPKQPTLIKGFYLPSEESAFVDDKVEEVAPFILVRLKKGIENDRDKFSVTSEVIVQIYSSDQDQFTGDTELLLCMNRIRDNILNKPILNDIFQYDGGFEWQIAEDQPVPNWEISLTMNWLVPNPQRSDYNEFI